jgi:hypothetical protein
MIVKTSFLGLNRLPALLALLVLVAMLPAWAESQPVAAASMAVPVHLAWDRVGSPLRMSV